MKLISALIYYPTKLMLSVSRKLSRMTWQHYSLYYCHAHQVKMGRSVQFKGRCSLKFYPGSKVSIGDGFICNSGVENSIDTSLCSKIVVHEGATLSIGKYSGVSNTMIHCHEQITIGDHVNVGAGTMIFDTNFHSTDWSLRRDRATDVQRATSAPVTIGDDVFIGAGCIICKGLTIGNKSMIAAGSVVTRSVPEGEVWGGNPATFIKPIEHENER